MIERRSTLAALVAACMVTAFATEGFAQQQAAAPAVLVQPAELAPIADRGEAAVIDLSQVTFIDSAVLSELVASRRTDEDGHGARLALVAPPGGFPARVLGLLQLGQVVGVYESRDEALASF